MLYNYTAMDKLDYIVTTLNKTVSKLEEKTELVINTDYTKPLEVNWVCRPCHNSFYD